MFNADIEVNGAIEKLLQDNTICNIFITPLVHATAYFSKSVAAVIAPVQTSHFPTPPASVFRCYFFPSLFCETQNFFSCCTGFLISLFDNYSLFSNDITFNKRIFKTLSSNTINIFSVIFWEWRIVGRLPSQAVPAHYVKQCIERCQNNSQKNHIYINNQ